MTGFWAVSAYRFSEFDGFALSRNSILSLLPLSVYFGFTVTGA